MTTTQQPLGVTADGSKDGRLGRKNGRVLPTTPLAERSLGELVATLSRDLALLVHQEVELVKADLKATGIKIAAGAAGFVVAMVALLFSIPIFSIAAALGINALGITLGFSFLIVAGAWVLVALLAAAAGIMPLRKAKSPKRVVDSMKADLQAIARMPKPSHAPSVFDGVPQAQPIPPRS